MDLIIKDRLIKTPIITIIKQLKSELLNHKLKDVSDKHSYVLVTCPHHKGGMENHPSCGVYSDEVDEDGKNIVYGTCHCFCCGFKGSLMKFIGECFDADESFGEEWLLERFGNTQIIETEQPNIKPIILENISPKSFLNESILDNLRDYHPYMSQRNLTPDVIKKFKIKYDPEVKAIVFPVWDEFNRLVMLTKRSVEEKRFYIDKDIEKPVYLLNNIINNHIKEVYVCESQINTLTLYG